MDILHSAMGLLLLTGMAWVLSESRVRAQWRVALTGIVVQVLIAVLLLKVPWADQVFVYLNKAVLALQQSTEAGTSFVFGFLGGGEPPFTVTKIEALFVLAFKALPLVIVISALTALLTYWRILPWIVRGISRVLEKAFGIGGAVGLGTAANVFVGMVEAPLFVRSYLAALSRGELFMLMTAGMATVAGTVLVLYATFISPVVPNAIGHLLTASLISAPAAITIAQLMVPHEGKVTGAELDQHSEADSGIDALTRGTMSGLKLYLNIVAMLIVFVALVHLFNLILALLPDAAGAPLSLERILGWVMAPLAWLMGVPWSEAATAGSLLGVKTVLNEFLAYLQFAALPESALSERSGLIMAYALCGFANFGSLGILVGGLVTMVPERHSEIVGLGLKSIVAGTLATCCTGAVVGMLN